MVPGLPFEFARRAFLRGVAVLAVAAGPVAAQEPAAQYRGVEPATIPLDRPGIWTLNFAYTPIRIIEVNTPDKGKRIVWYMVYQVWNKSEAPQLFVPLFELVTKDFPPANYLDEPQPAILKRIQEIEDPTGALNIQSSVSISRKKIPVTKVDSIPRAVYGVAIWLDVAEKSATTNQFSVYATGLSNGLSVADKDDGSRVVSRKALQIDFVRETDNARNRVADIRPADNRGLGAERWIYRPTSIIRPEAAKPAEPPEPKDEK